MERLLVSALDKTCCSAKMLALCWLLKFGNCTINLGIGLRPAKFNLFDKDKLQMTCLTDQLCEMKCK